MKMAKLSGSNTVGQDIDGDGRWAVRTSTGPFQARHPPHLPPGGDQRGPLPPQLLPGRQVVRWLGDRRRFDWVEGSGEEEVRRSQWHITPDHLLHPCVGYWGIAIKEWEVIKQVEGTSER